MQIIIIISVSSRSTVVECAMHVGSHYMRIVHCIVHIHMCADSDSLLTLKLHLIPLHDRYHHHWTA